jgi:hypothetical protein
MGLESAALAALVGPALGGAMSGIFGQPTGGTGVQGFQGRLGGGQGPPAREMLEGSFIGDVLGQQESYLGTAMGNLANPISLPGARVEPLQGYGGGAMPMRIGANAIDPAFRQPQQLVRPGMNLVGLDDWDVRRRG